MVDAIPCLATDKAVELFGKYKVFSKAELESRVEIKYENYAKAINIEAKTMIDMASKQILPAVIGYTKSLADTILAVKGAGAPTTVQTDLLNDVSKLLEEAKAALVTLEEVTDKAAEAGDMAAEARYFHESVVPAMAALRTPVDKLEVLVDKKVWPMHPIPICCSKYKKCKDTVVSPPCYSIPKSNERNRNQQKISVPFLVCSDSLGQMSEEPGRIA